MDNEQKYIIKLAEEADLSRLTEIYNWAVLHSVATFDLTIRTEVEAKNWFKLHDDLFYPLYVVQFNGLIAGWGSISPFHPRPAYRQSGEFSIYLDPTFQFRGLGSMLLGHLCDKADQLGYHTLLGLITSVNYPSLRVAEKHGFKKVGHYREVGRKFDQWLDVVVVQKHFE